MDTGAKIGLTLLLVVYLGSAYWLLKHTKLLSWLKYIYVFSIFPLVAILVTLSIIIVGHLSPEIIQLVSSLDSNYGTAKLGAFLALLITTPFTLMAYFGWVKLLTFFDKKIKIDD